MGRITHSFHKLYEGKVSEKNRITISTWDSYIMYGDIDHTVTW